MVLFQKPTPALQIFFNMPLNLHLIILVSKILFLRFYLFIFRERGREGEKNQCVVVSCIHPTGDLPHNPGMCPDWVSKQWPFGFQGHTQSTEPHQPEQCLKSLQLYFCNKTLFLFFFFWWVIHYICIIDCENFLRLRIKVVYTSRENLLVFNIKSSIVRLPAKMEV